MRVPLPFPEQPKETSYAATSYAATSYIGSAAPTSHSLSDYQIRALTLDEISTIAPEFFEKGVSIPDPSVSNFIGVLLDGKIVAWQCIQLRCHVDPIRIDPEHYRVYRSLVHHTQKFIEATVPGPIDVYVFTPIGSNQERLAQLEGMTKEPWTVHSKRIYGTYQPPASVFGYDDEPIQPATDLLVQTVRSELEKQDKHDETDPAISEPPISDSVS